MPGRPKVRGRAFSSPDGLQLSEFSHSLDPLHCGAAMRIIALIDDADVVQNWGQA